MDHAYTWSTDPVTQDRISVSCTLFLAMVTSIPSLYSSSHTLIVSPILTLKKMFDQWLIQLYSNNSSLIWEIGLTSSQLTCSCGTDEWITMAWNVASLTNIPYSWHTFQYFQNFTRHILYNLVFSCFQRVLRKSNPLIY